MKHSRKGSLVLCLAVCAVMAGLPTATSATAEQQKSEEELPPGMTAEQMAAWQEATTPGAEHERLAAMAGEWTFEGTFWMAPDAPPMTTTGTAQRKMTFGGRVLVEKVHSEWQGEAFEGMAMTGFDNVSGEYWGTWVDNMSTGLMVSSGSCTKDSCEFTGSYNDPMTGASKVVRMTMTFAGGREVHQSFELGPDGEFKSMELVYTRAK